MTPPGETWIEVAAAVLERPDGSFLLAQRPPGKVYEGWWEFPGGKAEPGEPVDRALVRELHEELGIDAETAYPWIVRTHRYAHGNVRLHFFRVTAWRGEPRSQEGQAFAWERLPEPSASPILPANGPVLAALGLPLFMGISQAATLGPEGWLSRLDAAVANGLRLVQFREPGWDSPARVALARAAAARIAPAGGRLVFNGTEAEARAAGAEGLHLTARALMQAGTRPDFALVGASVHDERELDAAERLGADYVILGPVRETATHPGAAALGWPAFSVLAAGRPFPVFAVGGLSPADLVQARSAGAHGIAAIRAAWAEPALLAGVQLSGSSAPTPRSSSSTGMR